MHELWPLPLTYPSWVWPSTHSWLSNDLMNGLLHAELFLHPLLIICSTCSSFKCQSWVSSDLQGVNNAFHPPTSTWAACGHWPSCSATCYVCTHITKALMVIIWWWSLMLVRIKQLLACSLSVQLFLGQHHWVTSDRGQGLLPLPSAVWRAVKGNIRKYHMFLNSLTGYKYPLPTLCIYPHRLNLLHPLSHGCPPSDLFAAPPPPQVWSLHELCCSPALLHYYKC